MTSRFSVLALIVANTLLAGMFSAAAHAQSAPAHPLEPLSKQEVLDTVSVVKHERQFGPSSRFMLIQLKEPLKQEVLAYRPGAKFARQAFVIVYDYASNTTTEAIVDLRGKRLLSWLELNPVD